MNLPEYVIICPVCDGKGEYEQMYTAGCGMGYFTMPGACNTCCETQRGFQKGSGLVYKATMKPIPKSVEEQIKNMQV